MNRLGRRALRVTAAGAPGVLDGPLFGRAARPWRAPWLPFELERRAPHTRRPTSHPCAVAAPWPLQAAGAALAAKRGFAAVSKDELADYLEQTTGPEREELEAKAKGIENPWHEAW